MKKVFKLRDLDCANCARKMEDAIRRIDGVEDVQVSFLTQKLTLVADDARFDEIVEKMKEADTIVIGSPVYWHNMSGLVRNLIDRFYGPVPSGALKGRKFVFLFQGAAPEGWMMEKAEYTMSRFAKMYGMTYVGMATNEKEAKNLSGKI